MRTSLRRTPIAVLREIVGIKDFELSEILGCSRYTIHSLESGRRRLCTRMALRLSRETGICPGWLLGGNAEAPPVAAGGERYTKEHFECAQAAKSERTPLGLEQILSLWNQELHSILESAMERKQCDLVVYKVTTALKKWGDVFGRVSTETDNQPTYIHAECKRSQEVKLTTRNEVNPKNGVEIKVGASRVILSGPVEAAMDAITQIMAEFAAPKTKPAIAKKPATKKKQRRT